MILTLVVLNDQRLFVKSWSSKHRWSLENIAIIKWLTTSRLRSAFFDLCPCIAEANGTIEHQSVLRAAINAIITKALKLIFCPMLCISHTRFYFAIVQNL